jgi:hypothetical protein
MPEDWTLKMLYQLEKQQSWMFVCSDYGDRGGGGLEPGVVRGFTTDEFIDPDPDIAGIGVILAFTVIGAVIMSLISIKLFIEWRRDFSLQLCIAPPREEGLTEGGRRPTIQDAKRYVEREAADEVQIPGRQGRMALSSTFFGLADTQFASGIAICAAALAKHDITAYHFSICNEMAWLAQIT